MSTSTDWSSRPVLTALSPERLAALVDSSLSRSEGLLFTATTQGLLTAPPRTADQHVPLVGGSGAPG